MTQTTTPESVCIGIDLGMGATKLYGSAGGVLVPSSVAVSKGSGVSDMAGMQRRKPPMRVKVNGFDFFVGRDAHDFGSPVEDLSYERMNGVPETRSLTYAALTWYDRQYGLPQNPLKATAGLPLAPLSGPEAQDNANQVRAWLKGEHAWEADDQPYRIEMSDAVITSQPVGALFDDQLDEQGQFIPERKGYLAQEVGILSIGFNTVEILTVKDSAPVPSMTTGVTSGVRRLLELVNRDGLYTMGELDSRLRAGALDVKAALPVWGREVTGQIEKAWGQRWRRFARILLVGGGALLLKDPLVERFNGKVYLPDDPVMSIARGLYKLGLMQSRRKAK